ncbi:hypothetical protein RKD23_007651 [Streptomyces sp. SAI-170]|uniref:peptidoglycan-binding domain-containing protein n=1 Tax=Streptomyces sp. SAI-170 TaxID=3377729 RepID=UPI003C7E9245
MGLLCFTPGDVTSNPATRSMIGEAAEVLIKHHYCSTKGGCHEFLRFPGGPQTDFFDVSMGFHRCRHLASYLKIHNPHIDAVALASECESKKEGLFSFPIPDIITHEVGRFEFYEVKPNSRSGEREADKKVDWFIVISDPNVFNLPYKPGQKYSPDERVLLWDGTWFSAPAKVHFHWKRTKPGVILYEFCIEASLDILVETLWKMLVKAVVLAVIVIILRQPKQEPVPTPELPAPLPRIPVPIPAPVPVPVPVPSFFVDPVHTMNSPMRESVGSGGVNDPEDVRYAQLMLNQWIPRATGLAALDVDGLVGPLTIEAIHTFQEIMTGVVDDRLDAGGTGIRTLEADHWVSLVASVPMGFDNPLEGDFTTEEAGEEGPLLGIDPEAVLAEAMQDYFDTAYTSAGSLEG